MFKQLDKSAATNRYFAKLTLREKRRRAGIPQFNIDAWVTDSLNSMPKARDLCVVCGGLVLCSRSSTRSPHKL